MNTVSATVIGSLAGGALLFLSSIIVPIISKRLNKATDAAASAEKISTGAEKNAGMALRIAEGLEQKLEKTEKQCSDCLVRLSRRDRVLDTVHAALVEIVPMLPPDDPATALVRAVVSTIAQSRDGL